MSGSSVQSQVFLLSPASVGGRRAQILLSDRAAFPLAERLRTGSAVTLGEIFSFLSGLYFRGKLAYANHFARPPAGVAGTQIITANRGLLPADTPITPAELRDFGTVDIRVDDPRYRYPLERDVARLAAAGAGDIVLLGSLATNKYVDVLLDVVGERLLFPTAFTGRGNLSRGALLLRAVRAGDELAYAPVRRGPTNDHDTTRARGEIQRLGEAGDADLPRHHSRRRA